MSRFNSPKANKAGRRCTVCGSPYHDRREHSADERLGSRTTQEAPALERQYQSHKSLLDGFGEATEQVVALRAENKRLRAALLEIAENAPRFSGIDEIARNALSG